MTTSPVQYLVTYDIDGSAVADQTMTGFVSSGTGSLTVASGDNNDATLTVNVIRTITASAGAGGTITPSGSVFINNHANQAFLIVPDPGFIVADVLVDSVSQGRINTFTFSGVTADHTISATFEGGWTAPTLTSDTGQLFRQHGKCLCL